MCLSCPSYPAVPTLVLSVSRDCQEKGLAPSGLADVARTVRSPTVVFTYTLTCELRSSAKISKVCVNELSFNPLVLPLHCRLHTGVHTQTHCSLR